MIRWIWACWQHPLIFSSFFLPIVGKHVHRSFHSRAPVYVCLLTSCGRHITTPPGTFRKGSEQSMRTFTCTETQLNMKCIPYKNGREKHPWKAGESHPSSQVCTCTELYSLSSMPLRLILSALHGSLGPVARCALGLASPQGRDLDLKERSERKKKQTLKSRVLGERRQTAYQRLINPWSVICTVRPLRIGIKTRDARGRVRLRDGRRGGVMGQWEGARSPREGIKEISFRWNELHCHLARIFFVSLISFSPSLSQSRQRTREKRWDKI